MLKPQKLCLWCVKTVICIFYLPPVKMDNMLKHKLFQMSKQAFWILRQILVCLYLFKYITKNENY